MPSSQPQLSIPPAAQVLEMAFGIAVSRCVYTAAKLNIADLLRNGPMTIESLAQNTGTNPGALYRVERALASTGMFTETSPREFALSPLAEPLRTDVPESIRAMVLFIGDHIHNSVYSQLQYSVETGKPAFKHVFGQEPFEYLPQHPEDAKVFNDAMSAHSNTQNAAIVQAYDFGRFGTVADIGGGHGHLLAAILHGAPQTQGILFDLPHAIEHARAKALLPADRSRLIAGSFFENVPAADAYILKHIIHDWDDGQARQILSTLRKAIPAQGKLLIAELIVTGMNEPGFAKLLDIEMLLIPGGCERTVEEYKTLLASAGFNLTRVIPTRASIALIEAEPA